MFNSEVVLYNLLQDSNSFSPIEKERIYKSCLVDVSLRNKVIKRLEKEVYDFSKLKSKYDKKLEQTKDELTNYFRQKEENKIREQENKIKNKLKNIKDLEKTEKENIEQILNNY